MFTDHCPVCSTKGRIWHKKPEAFVCPKCMSYFSQFGMVMESGMEFHEVWS